MPMSGGTFLAMRGNGGESHTLATRISGKRLWRGVGVGGWWAAGAATYFQVEPHLIGSV